MSAVKKEHLQFAASSPAVLELLRGLDIENGHAFIFDSPDTLLSRAAAYLIAARSVCPELCLGCKKCARATGGNCLDIIDLSDGKVMTGDIDALMGGSGYAPYELPYKFYFLDFSERNDAVQNKLLITLEQPPPSAKYIIITRSLASVLPTVRSRCTAISVRLPEKELISIEEEFNPNLPYARYGARGSLTEFDGILTGKNVEYLICALNVVRTLGKSGDMVKILKYLPTGGTDARERLKKTLGYLEIIYGDIMKAHASIFTDTYGLYNMKQMTDKIAAGGIAEALAALRRAVSRTAGGNLASVVDELLLKLTEVNYNAQSGRN